jgi:hypothetical protein
MDIVKVQSSQPSAVHNYLANFCDIRGTVFAFIGVNKDIAAFRFVSRDWKEFVDEYLKQVYNIKKHNIGVQRPLWDDLHRSMPQGVKDAIEIAEVRKVLYESFDKNRFLRSIKMLAKISTPSKATKEGILAAMYLLLEQDELSKVGDAMDWKYCRKKLLNRNFVKGLGKIKPEDLTQDKMAKFEAALGLEMITEYDQMYASIEARNVYMWAVNIVEYKQFLDTLTEQSKEAIRQCKVQKTIEKEFGRFENIVKMIGEK